MPKTHIQCIIKAMCNIVTEHFKCISINVSKYFRYHRILVTITNSFLLSITGIIYCYLLQFFKHFLFVINCVLLIVTTLEQNYTSSYMFNFIEDHILMHLLLALDFVPFTLSLWRKYPLCPTTYLYALLISFF